MGKTTIKSKHSPLAPRPQTQEGNNFIAPETPSHENFDDIIINLNNLNKSLKNATASGSNAHSTLNISKTKSRMQKFSRAEGTRSMLNASQEENYFSEKRVSITKYLDQQRESIFPSKKRSSVATMVNNIDQ